MSNDESPSNLNEDTKTMYVSTDVVDEFYIKTVRKVVEENKKRKADFPQTKKSKNKR